MNAERRSRSDFVMSPAQAEITSLHGEGFRPATVVVVQ